MTTSTAPPPEKIANYYPAMDCDGFYYDPESADEAIYAFSNQCHVKGSYAGQPFVPAFWQEQIIRTLFGWYREDDDTRRYRSAFIFVPRKNGKSTFAAALANYILFCDGEAGAECYCAASDREQAGLVYSIASGMVSRSPVLSKNAKVVKSQKRIIVGTSFLRAIPANEGTTHGFNSHLVIGDELHAWIGREMYDALHTSFGSRTQPLEIHITTAGWDRNSICYEIYKYACQVRDGQINDPSFLPVIYQAEEGDDWTDTDVWRKANPNFGISVRKEYLHTECEKAKLNPAYENTFRRLFLNQWTSQESRWIPMDKWRRCPAVKEPIPDNAMVFGGLDLSQNVDITAWVLVRKTEYGYLQVRGHYFIPEERMREREQRDRVPYSKWIEAGYVTATPGAAIDYSYIHQRILDDSKRYQIGAVGYDPYNAEPTRILLEGEGLTMVQIRQGYAKLSTPAKELERCILQLKLDHGNDPVMEWFADNVQVKTDEYGNIRPVKPEHKSAKKIDGIVATLLAIAVSQTTELPGPSVYEDEGSLAL